MTIQKTISLRIWAELLLLALIWGGTFLAVGVAVREVEVFTLVAFRVIGGAILLWIFVFLRYLPIPTSPRIWGAFLVMGLLNNVLPFLLIAWGQKHIDAGLAAILNGSTAIFGVLVAAALFADEKLSPRKTIGVILGFLGMATAIGLSNLANFDVTSMAQLAIIAASLSYAIAGAWARTSFEGIPLPVTAAGMAGASALITAILALAIDGKPAFDYTPNTWGALFYLASIATALAYLLYYRILAAAGSGNLLLVTLLIPPVAIVLGAVFLAETLTGRAALGFGILAIGLLILDGRIFGLLSRKSQD